MLGAYERLPVVPVHSTAIWIGSPNVAIPVTVNVAWCVPAVGGVQVTTMSRVPAIAIVAGSRSTSNVGVFVTAMFTGRPCVAGWFRTVNERAIGVPIGVAPIARQGAEKKRVVGDEQSPRSQVRFGPFEIPRVTFLVGVNEHEIERPFRCELGQNRVGGADMNANLV